MRGWGFKVQVGRTYFALRTWPFHWEYQTILSDPDSYGFGLWLTHDRWFGRKSLRQRVLEWRMRRRGAA